MTLKNVKKVAVVAAFSVLISGCAFSQAVFKLVHVPGTTPNSFIAIDNNGEVLVNTRTSNSYEVSTWSRLSGPTYIGLTGITNGGTAMNNSGEFAGAGNPGSGHLEAFVWLPSGGLEWLGSLGGELSAANGINDAGAVVGLSYTAAYVQHAFLWTASGGMQDLTPDLTSIGGATANAINSSNEVVGYYFPSGSHQAQGFVWTQAGGLENLGPTGTLAFGINNSGIVVGQSPVASGQRHAFSWTGSGGLKDLGTLGGGESSALNINSAGWIVGTALSNLGDGVLHGFLWTPLGGMQDFTTLAGLSVGQQAYSVQVNDFGVIALSTSNGGYVLVPKMTGTIASSANPSTLGQSVTFTVSINSVAGTPPDGETVEFVVSGKVYGSATLNGGVARFTTSAIPAGSHTVVANYSGDANYLAANYTAVTQMVEP